MPTLTVGHPEAGEFAPFYAGYVQLVTEEPVAALEAQARATQALLAGLSDAQAGHRYAEGKWTVRDNGTTEKVHSIEITPQMRKSVLHEGQPIAETTPAERPDWWTNLITQTA